MKLTEGDVFNIPIDDKHVGFGQIIYQKNKNSGVFMIIVFKGKFKKDASLNFEEVKGSGILYMGYTMDAKLYHKHWDLMGNYPFDIDSLTLPFYRLGTPPDDIYILDYTGKKLRECTLEEFDKLHYKSSVAPIRYEKALKAYHKLLDWDIDYDKLLYKEERDFIPRKWRNLINN